jgi:hypothetical protein
MLRRELADEVDQFLQYDVADNARTLLQTLLDACVHNFDKAIDLYALGTGPNGDGVSEWRASAFGYVAAEVLILLPNDARAINAARALYQMMAQLVYWVPQPPLAPRNPLVIVQQPPPVFNALGLAPPGIDAAIAEELGLQVATENRWFDLVRSLATNFVGWSRLQDNPVIGVLEDAGIEANGAAPVAAGFVEDVPRDVPTVLEDEL